METLLKEEITMSIYTLIVIIGTLMIIGGISLAATPLMTFVTAGYFIIILFFVAGIIGIIRAVYEKRYDRSFIVGENLWHVTFF